MPRKVWKPIIDGQEHTIEVKASGLTGSGELFIDSKIIDAWSASLTSGGTRHFEIAGKPAVLKATTFSYDLIIDGEKVKKYP
jgi:hypothetical protein